MKKVFMFVGIIAALVLALAAGLVLFLTVTEYKPAEVQAADMITADDSAVPAAAEQSFVFYSWNTGYAGLGRESDFFMDGGKSSVPPDTETIEKNMAGILDFMKSTQADAWLLQELDVNSSRTRGIDQYGAYASAMEGGGAFAYNYNCPFVPIPLPPMGRVESGIATFTTHAVSGEPMRISLPCPFSWPVRAAQIKRCLLVTRLPLEGREEELVLVNLHLEAYDDGEGKRAQTELLLNILEEEYARGNYVIAGGDFNQSFPGALEKYPVDEGKWMPGVLEESQLPQGWSFVWDDSVPTCRLLDAPYDGTNQKYVIDGFILSPNVELSAVETVELGFEFADHNPVRLEVRLASGD